MKNDPEEEQQQKKRTNFKIENSLKCFFFIPNRNDLSAQMKLRQIYFFLLLETMINF